jgi:TrmH family RNA methyltransferase
MTSISILLVEPENPDNIGAVCRAMKNTGFGDLRLVRPPHDWKKKSEKMAMAGADLIEKANVFSTVEEALADRQLVIGTTRRGGPRRGFFMPFRKAIKTLSQRTAQGDRCAVMFGKESKGLDNHSLSLCHWVTTIPVHPDCPSINLAQAVMIITFKLFEITAVDADIEQYRATASIPKRGRIRALNPKKNLKKIGEYQYLSKAEMDGVLDCFESALTALEYEKKGNQVLSRIRRTFQGLLKRSGLMESEAQMIRGLSRRITEKVKVEDQRGKNERDNG